MEREPRVIVDDKGGRLRLYNIWIVTPGGECEQRNFNGEITGQQPTDPWVERTAAIESFVPERNYCLPKSAARGVFLSGTRQL